MKTLVMINLPTIPDQNSVDLDQISALLTKISDDPQALQQILAIRDGLYTSEGDTLRKILLDAATNPTERDALIAGIQYEKGRLFFHTL